MVWNMQTAVRAALALGVAALAACGGGGEAVTAATAPAPVLRVEGRAAPQADDLLISSVKSRSAALAPVPARVALGPLAQSKQLGDTTGPMLVGAGRDVIATGTRERTLQQLNWRAGEAGAQVAAISFTAEEAHGLRLGVRVGALPGSAMLRVYSQARPDTVFQISGQEVLQRIERNRNAGDHSDAGRTWWTPDIGSAEVTLEIELPAGVPAGALDIAVPRVSHIFAALEIPQEQEVVSKINESDPCNLDATCYDAYANQRNAVARMLFVNDDGLTYACTGTLLSDASGSGTPYFLSANHCISSQTAASTLQTDWFYRSPACNSRTLSSATTKRYNGATLLYASSSTDTSFLRLNDAPPAGTFFAGWDASAGAAATGTPVVGLHHPQADLLKISFGSVVGQSSCTSAGGTQVTCSGTSGNFYRVGWSQGTTQGGSSGSALFSSDGRYVMGTLYAGNAVCGVTTSADFYGRFDVAYNTALKQWLGTASAGARRPIYRFYNATTGAHFFTPSAQERDYVIATYPAFAYEGVAFYAYDASAAGQDVVYRFYNTTTGAHFYTISAAERNYVQMTYPAFKYEGPAWSAQAAAGGSATGIFRFYKPSTGTHFYTISAAERDFVIATYKDYNYEGVAYYAWTGN